MTTFSLNTSFQILHEISTVKRRNKMYIVQCSTFTEPSLYDSSRPLWMIISSVKVKTECFRPAQEPTFKIQLMLAMYCNVMWLLCTHWKTLANFWYSASVGVETQLYKSKQRHTFTALTVVCLHYPLFWNLPQSAQTACFEGEFCRFLRPGFAALGLFAVWRGVAEAEQLVFFQREEINILGKDYLSRLLFQVPVS